MLQEEGIKSFWFKLLSEIGYYRRLILLERSLEAPISEIKPLVTVNIELLKKTELDEYATFRSKNDLIQIENDPYKIADRLNAGHWSFVARHGGEIISDCWASIHHVRFSVCTISFGWLRVKSTSMMRLLDRIFEASLSYLPY